VCGIQQAVNDFQRTRCKTARKENAEIDLGTKSLF
jgi:hypothetical protein